ncbi:hypothetical protein IKE96_03380 [bacterium]|nr:hypothetical protein [bacterium]
MDVQIYYEHAERELYNAFLIKFELEKRGYEVLISRHPETKVPFLNAPKLIITPWLFGEHNLVYLRRQYLRKYYRILNMQYEQVTSGLWLDIGYHVPSDKARNANILCWGNYRKQILLNDGISPEKIVVIGDIRQDFAKPEFRDFFKTKKELSVEFNIPINHEWNLFVSSFSFTNQEEESRIYFEDLMGKKYYEEWCDCNIKSQEIVLEWIKQFIDENPNHEFIYRPHPSEIKENDYTLLKELDEMYSNFHFIFKYSVQDWIFSCDFINFWFSTSIVECYSLNKSCNIVRPIEIDEYLDVPFYINAEHITDYDSFSKKNLLRDNNFPIDSDEIKAFYDSIDGEGFVYKKICDYIEELINDESTKSDFYNKNLFIDNLKFFLTRITTGRLLTIFKNVIKDKKDNEVKKTLSIDTDKINILKKIVDENFE